MFVVTSTFTLGAAQFDGRIPVTERHTDIEGNVHEYEYLNDGVDPQLILDARAQIIESTLAQREAALEAVIGTVVGIAPYDFLMRFTTAERIAIRDAAKLNGIVDDFIRLLDSANKVRIPHAAPGIAYLVAIGLLTQERATIILAD